MSWAIADTGKRQRKICQTSHDFTIPVYLGKVLSNFTVRSGSHQEFYFVISRLAMVVILLLFSGRLPARGVLRSCLLCLLSVLRGHAANGLVSGTGIASYSSALGSRLSSDRCWVRFRLRRGRKLGLPIRGCGLLMRGDTFLKVDWCRRHLWFERGYFDHSILIIRLLCYVSCW